MEGFHHPVTFPQTPVAHCWSSHQCYLAQLLKVAVLDNWQIINSIEKHIDVKQWNLKALSSFCDQLWSTPENSQGSLCVLCIFWEHGLPKENRLEDKNLFTLGFGEWRLSHFYVAHRPRCSGHSKQGLEPGSGLSPSPGSLNYPGLLGR